MDFGEYQGASAMYSAGVESGNDSYNVDDTGPDSGMSYDNAASNYMTISDNHDRKGDEREFDAEEMERELAGDPDLEQEWASTSPQIFDFTTLPDQNQTRTQNNDNHNHQQQQSQKQSKGTHASGDSLLGSVPPRRSPKNSSLQPPSLRPTAQSSPSGSPQKTPKYATK
jgi:hypothetical protein